MGSQERRDLFFQFVGEVAAVGGGLVEEHGRDAGERLPAPLQREQRVLHRRRIRAADNRIDLGELLGEALIERRAVVLVADVGERRQPERQGAGREERICHAVHASCRCCIGVASLG